MEGGARGGPAEQGALPLTASHAPSGHLRRQWRRSLTIRTVSSSCCPPPPTHKRTEQPECRARAAGAARSLQGHTLHLHGVLHRHVHGGRDQEYLSPPSPPQVIKASNSTIATDQPTPEHDPLPQRSAPPTTGPASQHHKAATMKFATACLIAVVALLAGTPRRSACPSYLHTHTT